MSKQKYFSLVSGAVVLAGLPFFAHAGTVFDVLNLLINIVTSIIPILLSLAVLVFMWGIVKFIAQAGDEKAVAEGKQLMIWGMIALFVMVAFWGIVGYLQSSLGLDAYSSLPPLQQQADTIPTP